jgi:hypothetical protein
MTVPVDPFACLGIHVLGMPTIRHGRPSFIPASGTRQRVGI